MSLRAPRSPAAASWWGAGPLVAAVVRPPTASRTRPSASGRRSQARTSPTAAVFRRRSWTSSTPTGRAAERSVKVGLRAGSASAEPALTFSGRLRLRCVELSTAVDTVVHRLWMAGVPSDQGGGRGRLNGDFAERVLVRVGEEPLSVRSWLNQRRGLSFSEGEAPAESLRGDRVTARVSPMPVRWPRQLLRQAQHWRTAREEHEGMFERFTDRARRVVVLAQEEARMLNHNYIGTEHILLGLIHEGEGVAAKALESLGISLEGVRQQVEEIIGQGQQAPSGHIPFTPRAKKVLELSLREALQLGHNYIGTEHILLGLIREGEGVAAQVLVKLGADLNRVRQQVIQLLSGYQGKETAEAGTGGRGGESGSPSTSLVLDQFGRNLTAAAMEGKLDPVIGREKEIERVMQVLSRRTKNNPVLIGEPGVGKTAVVE